MKVEAGVRAVVRAYRKWRPGPSRMTRMRLHCMAVEQFEVVDCKELAKRWFVPVSWVRYYTAPTLDSDIPPIPHLKMGRYTRFLYGSKELDDWLKARLKK
jgi:hypothetical protein